MAKHTETAKHIAVYEAWYAANRDFRKISQNLALNIRTLYEWADKFGWTERADRRDLEASRLAEQNAIERKAKMIEAQRKAGEALRSLGMRYLAQNKDTAVANLPQAIQAIEKGFALERQAEGLPDWVVSILNATDDELRDRYLDIERALALAGSYESGGEPERD